jgi:integrase
VLYTGLRPRELCNLRWKDVDFRRRHLEVQSKNGHLRRVPFESKVLRLRKKRQPHSEFVLGNFPRSTLRKVSRQLTTLSAFTCKRIVTLQMLRRTFMSRWMNVGGDPFALGVVVGCTNYSSFFKNLAPPDQQEAAAVKFQNQLENS